MYAKDLTKMVDDAVTFVDGELGSMYEMHGTSLRQIVLLTIGWCALAQLKESEDEE